MKREEIYRVAAENTSNALGGCAILLGSVLLFVIATIYALTFAG